MPLKAACGYHEHRGIRWGHLHYYLVKLNARIRLVAFCAVVLQSHKMKQDPMFVMSEAMYLRELAERDQLHSRMQLPLALIVSIAGVLGFLLQNSSFNSNSAGAIAFVIFLVASAFSLFLSGSFLMIAIFGSAYKYIATLDVIQRYRDELHAAYREYDECDALVEKYLTTWLKDSYCEASTFNAYQNGKRSKNVYFTNACVLVAAALLAVAYMLFFFGGYEKNASPLSIQVAGQTMPIAVKIESAPRSLNIPGLSPSTTLDTASDRLGHNQGKLYDQRHETAPTPRSPAGNTAGEKPYHTESHNPGSANPTAPSKPW